jgi:type III secretion system FlhB-like substrate exporter
MENQARGNGLMKNSAPKWSGLKLEDKLFISCAAKTLYDGYVAAHGRKLDAKARGELAGAVCKMAEERAVPLNKSILCGHVNKLLLRLVRGREIPRSLRNR